MGAGRGKLETDARAGMEASALLQVRFAASVCPDNSAAGVRADGRSAVHTWPGHRGSNDDDPRSWDGRSFKGWWGKSGAGLRQWRRSKEGGSAEPGKT